MDAEQALVLQEPCLVSDEFPATVRVLVVDSDLNSLLVLENMMKHYSYQVISSDNAEEALSYLRTRKDELDIVIWDLHMSGTNGLEALAIITSEMDLPVIIMSRDLERESVKEAVMKGACDYLVKPVSKETVAVIWQHIVRMKTGPGLVRTVPQLTDQTAEYRNDPEFEFISNEEESRAAEARKLKKHRMTWTNDLHRKFLEAVNLIGIEKAVPKEILKCMQRMKVRGLTRNNVASHLQKYRLSLQRDCRFPKETTDQRYITETASNTSSLYDQNNVLHTFLSNYVMNSTAPELSNGYNTTNNTCMNDPQPQPQPQYPFIVDHSSIYTPPLLLPDPKPATRESGHPMHGGGHPELIDSSMFEYGSDIFQDVLQLPVLDPSMPYEIEL